MRYILLCLVLIAGPLFAQDRQGRDTPGEWIITYHKSFGLWDSFCDERITGDVLEQRCYVRYVDVFSQKPDFAAQFFFLTLEGLEFGIERGTRFNEDGFKIVKDDQTIWVNTNPSCLRGKDCTFAGPAAAELLDLMRQGDALRFTFTDRNGLQQDLTWDLTAIEQILANYRAQSILRGLI
ncbi:hypothetical protein [Parasulfitobacter algicola]|uniref:Invasion associated locus B family protein n=1 Tax=Parasulfitobacter algicola TaxID=2614809 RepID=A0ABX2IM70_9RHOB|nr:hypothetical protein [Sulfitobacter algicola]NSX53625.1 hypothetical protein [Sulfitobacter algicola]